MFLQLFVVNKSGGLIYNQVGEVIVGNDAE